MGEIYLIGIMVTMLRFIDSHGNSLWDALAILIISVLWPAAGVVWGIILLASWVRKRLA